MAMQWLEGELRKTGDKQDALFAKQIAIVREFRGDIPLPVTPVEAPQVEVTRFSPEQREALEAKGYSVYELTGQSIESLREQGRPFWSTWHRDDPKFEALTSRRSEVAIDPKKLFIPRSNNKTLEQQLEAVAKYSEDLGIQGVKAVLGKVPDYTELAFAHLDKTGQRLFGEKYDYNYTRTQTRVGSRVADVGAFSEGRGLFVDYWEVYDRYGILHAAPLVVPVSGTK